MTVCKKKKKNVLNKQMDEKGPDTEAYIRAPQTLLTSPELFQLFHIIHFYTLRSSNFFEETEAYAKFT